MEGDESLLESDLLLQSKAVLGCPAFRSQGGDPARPAESCRRRLDRTEQGTLRDSWDANARYDRPRGIPWMRAPDQLGCDRTRSNGGRGHAGFLQGVIQFERA